MAGPHSCWAIVYLGRETVDSKNAGREYIGKRRGRKAFFKTDGQRPVARSQPWISELASAGTHVRRFSVHWRSAVGSDWTETLGILPGCRKSAIATTARTHELSLLAERPAAHHTRAIAVD
jgi:hypothetical protein